MENSIKVYSKDMELLAIFSDYKEAISPDAKLDLMYAPTVRLESNNIPTFSFQMLADSPKWNDIKSPLNLYLVDGIWFTPLSDNSYVYTTEEGEVSVVNVTCLGIESLLAYQYHQIYNINPYVYATKARFNRFVNGDAEFILYSYNCTNPGNTISSENCWNAVKQWRRTDDNGNKISYAILTADEYKPTGWEDTPSGVFLRSLTVSGNTATMLVESRTKIKTSKVFEYNAGGTYRLDANPLPTSIEEVKINSTVITTSSDGKTSTYTTGEKVVNYYSYNNYTGIVTLNYVPSSTEQINGVTITYTNNDFGKISPNATCSFAAGAEAVDIHSVVLLPKSSTRNKLVIDNEVYEDSQVRDSRGVIMPRGSAGYAMWAVLKNTGWTLGICDVIAKGFDASIDYGCFNIESDMKDTLSNIQLINELYGGILVFDNAHKILHYRAENSTDYDSYADGFNEWNGCVFREGKNMEEPATVTYDNKIITRAYLLGYGNLNVAKINNNKQYVENFSFTSDVYEGYLSQPLIYDTRDEGGQRQLLYWGKKELSKMCKPRKTVTLSVTDLRYLDDYSFEQFFVNDIVRVRYQNEHTGEEEVEEQRVVSWEYNPFALWDSTVELGDKTRNQVDIFKLIYNKSLNAPGTNGSGEISGSDIDINGSGDGDQNSLVHYIQLIARTTTENSDAIAGLILDTSATHAQVDLFAQYQKQTDNLLTKTYSGVTAYADGEVASLRGEAQGHWESLGQEIDAQGGLIIDLRKDYSALDLTVKQHWKDILEDEDLEIAAVVGLRGAVTKEYSYLEGVVEQHWTDITVTGKTEIKAVSDFRKEVSKDYAKSSDFTAYKKDVNGELVATKTSIQQISGALGAIRLNVGQATDRWGAANGIEFSLEADGIYVNDVFYNKYVFSDETIPLGDFVPEYVNTYTQIVDGWTWKNPHGGSGTYINGAMIGADTIMASAIYGGAIGLINSDSELSSLMYIRPASSYQGSAVEITAGATALTATDGDLFLSTRSASQLQLWANNNGEIFLQAPSIKATTSITEWSDKKVKKDIDYDMSKYLDMFDKIKPCSYKRIDGTSDRKHIGMIANDVEDALVETGIGAKGFAGFVKSSNGDLGLRYNEFIGLCIAKIQQQDRELKELRAMIEGA